MSVTGRVDFTGIENAGLDFSQLEDYINDEEDPNESIYFSDNLVTSDLKLPDSPRSAGKVSEGQLSLGQGRLFSQSNGPAVHHNRVSSVTLSVNGASNRSSIQINQTIANNNSETNNVHHLSSTLNANHSHQHHQQQHQQQIIHHHQQPIGHHQPSAHHQQTISLYDNKSHHHPHHLPESPPDSGSEPPYSPPNDDSNRIINNQGNLGTTSSSTTSSTSITNQQSHATSGEMLQTGSVDNLKHFSHYSNNQLKQLAPNELGLPVPPSHLHLPRNNNLVHLNALHGLNGPIPGHPDDGLLVHHLGPSVLNGPINLQSPSMLPGLSPASSGGHPPHLTSLYTPNDEQYIGPNSVSDCGPEGQGQGPNGSQQQQTKKRKMSESPKNVPNSALVNGNIVHIKQEPGGMSPEPGIGPNGGSIMVSMEDEYGFDYNASTEGPPSVYLDSAYQCIRFQTFQQTAWHTLCDASLKELPVPNYRVDADKGFNFSNADDAFVCQKKNHFQVTVHVQPIGDPHFVKTAECVKKVDNFYLHFYGVKVESPSQTIKIEQSQSDRSKKPFHPVLIELNPEQVSKTTVGRLHFSETTSNNMRKKGKPNPDQRYFYLVVSLCAHVGDQSYPIVSHASERIIVRASNPGQFENDMELSWQKGHTPESIYHAGRVGINTDRPDEPLVVHGNVKVTGHIIQPSDRRAKTNIEEISTREQLKNVSNIRVVRYQFTPEFAQQVGLKEEDINGTGIIAQEVRQILPDAVKETGDVILPTGERIEKLLVVNKERIFMENVGAVKELCKVTDNLETRIDELERMNKKLRRINRFDSIKSILSSSSVASASTVTCISNYSVGQNGKRFSHKLPHAYEPHGRKCSKHSNPEDNQVCTNRFMQSIIMILVFIMAFCLASIVALYILDYPRRHANDLAPSAHHNFDHQFSQQQHTQFVNKSQPSFQHSPSSSSISTLFTESPYSSSSLSSATASMLTKSQSTMNSRPRSDLDRGYTKSDTQYSVDSSAHNVGWSSTSSDQRPTSLPILRPRILGEPSRCSSLRSKVECPIHCCLELKHESESLYNHNLSKTKQSSSSSDDEKIKLDSSEDKSDLTKESEVKIKEPPKDENNSESQHKDVATASTLTASSSTPIATTTISTIKTNYVSLTSSTTQASNSPLGQRSNGVTVPLKLTAINNHVSEEVSSRVAHGRYNVDSSSSSASSSPESASHINNLAADSSPNYTVSGSNNSSNQPIDPIDQAINSKVALSDSFVANNKFAGYNNHHSQSSSSGMIYSKAEDYREKREARDSKSDVVSSQTAGELLVKRARAASESSRLPGSLIESMRLIELNATIGREFCTTWQCVQQSGSLLSYLVPLSKYMSLEYVTFQFSLSTALKVDNCEYKERPSPCRSSDLVPHTYHRPSEHEPIEEINPSFGIPIGLYARSTYVFRILSKDKNIDTPCSLPESELGSSYLEIELTFYRVCDK